MLNNYMEYFFHLYRINTIKRETEGLKIIIKIKDIEILAM